MQKIVWVMLQGKRFPSLRQALRLGYALYTKKMFERKYPFSVLQVLLNILCQSEFLFVEK